MLVDDAILVQKDGEWVATTDLSNVQVPPAISALLASRLDRLSPEERRVVEAAAVVGEVFDRSAVRALVSGESAGRIEDHLGRLLLKDVLRPVPSDLGGADGLRFRHILLRDAAYDAIPKAERASLHEAFAEHLQASLAERTTEFDEFIGYHLEQAHRMRDELGLHDEHTDGWHVRRSNTSARPGCGRPNEETPRRPRPCSATRSTCAIPTTPTGSRSRGCSGSPWRIRVPSPRRESC